MHRNIYKHMLIDLERGAEHRNININGIKKRVPNGTLLNPWLLLTNYSELNLGWYLILFAE